MRSSENVELNLNILKKIVIAMNLFLLAAIVAFIFSDNVQFWMFEFFSYYAQWHFLWRSVCRHISILHMGEFHIN